MGMTVTNANHCWDMAKYLGRSEKIKLIALLSSSLLQEEHTNKMSAKRFYGVWQDGDSADADELNKLIRGL